VKIKDVSLNQKVGVDSQGAVYVCGAFGSYSNPIDFDGTAGTDMQTAVYDEKTFLTKYNSDGSYGWTRAADFRGSCQGISVASNDSIYITGHVDAGGAGAQVDFDATAGQDLITVSSNQWSAFSLNIMQNGSYGYTRVLSGNPDTGENFYEQHIIETSSGLYGVGFYNGEDATELDFNPSSGTDMIANAYPNRWVSIYQNSQPAGHINGPELSPIWIILTQYRF